MNYCLPRKSFERYLGERERKLTNFCTNISASFSWAIQNNTWLRNIIKIIVNKMTLQKKSETIKVQFTYSRSLCTNLIMRFYIKLQIVYYIHFNQSFLLFIWTLFTRLYSSKNETHLWVENDVVDFVYQLKYNFNEIWMQAKMIHSHTH